MKRRRMSLHQSQKLPRRRRRKTNLPRRQRRLKISLTAQKSLPSLMNQLELNNRLVRIHHLSI